MHICAPVGIIIYHFFTKVNSRLSRALFIGEPRKQLAVLGNFDHIFWPFRQTEYAEHTEIMRLFVQFSLQNRTIQTKKDAKNASPIRSVFNGGLKLVFSCRLRCYNVIRYNIIWTSRLVPSININTLGTVRTGINVSAHRTSFCSSIRRALALKER